MGRKKAAAQKKMSVGHWLLIAAGVAVLVAVIVGMALFLEKSEPDPTQPSRDTTVKVEITQTDVMDLGKGLRVSKIGKYAGIFLEDGSNAPVSNLLMIILENTSKQDLQLARFSLEYEDFTAEFEATNLPAGESVVLLERNRHAYVEGTPKTSKLATTVFFENKMDLMTDTFRVSGTNGQLVLENISDTDISGDIFVYYKYSAGDLLYGGMTYRARFSGGVDAGEKSAVIATHYDPDSCEIIQITAGG